MMKPPPCGQFPQDRSGVLALHGVRHGGHGGQLLRTLHVVVRHVPARRELHDVVAIRGLIREGVLVSRAAPEIKLHEAAEDGNIDAVKLLTEIQERRLFENLLKDMDEYE